MISFICLCFLIQFSLQQQQLFPNLRSVVPVEDQIEEARRLVRRVLPTTVADRVVLDLISPTDEGKDRFRLWTTDDDANGQRVVHVHGSSGVAAAAGLLHYMKYYGNSSVSWGIDGTGDNLSTLLLLKKEGLPQGPPARRPLEISFPDRFRYYMNLCTSSYSMAWWDFARWEREIDWMALNGINLPLSFTGMEYVLFQLFQSEGLTRTELDQFFAGPAFLAWQRMGNLRGFAGPLPDSWLTGQRDLQLKILQRQRALGMVSVLPGFTGFVPAALKRVYPQAHIEPSSQWWSTTNQSICCNRMLQPDDELYSQLAQKYYKLLIETYGTDHIYNLDQFNEMLPRDGSLSYIASASKAAHAAMKAVDPKSVWLMQGWLFYAHSRFWSPRRVQAYLSSVDNDSMIVLDLMSEYAPLYHRFNSYFGKPYIWCLLHNFGGVRGLYGDLEQITNGPVYARQLPNSTMIGVGLTMEAIEHNPVVYDLALEMGWRETAVADLDSWLHWYASRRYGVADNPLVQTAWSFLLHSVYGKSSVFSKSLIEIPPKPRMHGVSGRLSWHWLHQPGPTATDSTALTAAWRALVLASEQDGKLRSAGNGPFQYDLVDVTRQVVSNIFWDLHRLYEAHFHRFLLQDDRSGLASIQQLGKTMLVLIERLDDLMATNVNFLLGPWVESARAWGHTEQEQQLYQFNALNLVTLWGPEGEIMDYSARTWAGLLRTYYLQRWRLFHERVLAAFTASRFSNVDSWYRKYSHDLMQFMQQWGKRQQLTPAELATQPRGQTLDVIWRLMAEIGGAPVNQTEWTITEFGPGLRCSASDQHVIFSPTGERQSWTNDVHQLAFLCNTDPACVGFTTDGLLLHGGPCQPIDKQFRELDDAADFSSSLPQSTNAFTNKAKNVYLWMK